MLLLKNRSESHPGPENAEYEIRQAYSSLIQLAVTLNHKQDIIAIRSEEVQQFYLRAFTWLKKGNRLAAERWARTAKHLARAFLHEASVSYLQKHRPRIPSLESTTYSELGYTEHSDDIQDLLSSAVQLRPLGHTQVLKQLELYRHRAQELLQVLLSQPHEQQLLTAERIEAIYEYARVLECMALALETENSPSP